MTANEPENPALRLARYLKEFVGLRTTTVRDVTKYDSVLWFGDMPQEPDCRSGAWTDDHDSDSPWLEVKKQRFEKAPPPPELALPWVNEKALKRATPDIPALLPSIFLPDNEVELEDGETPPLREHSLGDHPEVQQAYEGYRPSWEFWSTEHRRREAIQRVYAELFRLYTQARKQCELIEVVLGLGLLDWRAKLNEKVVPVRRHAVVGRVELEFDLAKGLIRVLPPGDGARLRIEDDMLEAEVRPDRTHYATVEMQLEEIGDEVWDRGQMHTALRAWAGALSPDSQWSEGLGAQTAPARPFGQPQRVGGGLPAVAGAVEREGGRWTSQLSSRSLSSGGAWTPSAWSTSYFRRSRTTGRPRDSPRSQPTRTSRSSLRGD